MVGNANFLALRALRRAGLLSHLELEFTLVQAGRKIRVPILGGLGLEHWWFPDAQMLPVIRNSLELSSGAFVDVGAHIGETLLKLLLVDDGRPYLGVEPQPAAAAYLERLLEANRRSGHIFAAALGDRNGIAELQLRGRWLDDSASIVTGFRADEHAEKRRPIPLVRGDDALAAIGIGRVGVLKIDVEGAEIEVLEGLAETIGRDRPVIVCEILPIYNESTAIGQLRRARSDAIVGFARERRYRVLRVREGGVEPLSRIETHADLALREHVLLPEEQEEQFIELAGRASEPPVTA